MPVRKSRLDATLVAAAIEEKAGNLSMVAKTFGISRAYLYRYIAIHPTLKAVLADARETMLDNAESALYKAVLKGEAWAVTFFLKTQGKTRAYTERSEISGPDGGPVPLSWHDFIVGGGDDPLP